MSKLEEEFDEEKKRLKEEIIEKLACANQFLREANEVAKEFKTTHYGKKNKVYASNIRDIAGNDDIDPNYEIDNAIQTVFNAIEVCGWSSSSLNC